jgi:ketosteroid isomerase-like protein
MGQAREVLDRLTAAVERGDFETLGACYADDAVAVTPDEGEIKGRDNIVGYFRPIVEAFPDVRWESLHSHESGNFAIDEGYICGTHTAPLHAPDGQTVPATGKAIRVRETDAVTVEDGLVTSHRFYFDQMDLLGQLGLL